MWNHVYKVKGDCRVVCRAAGGCEGPCWQHITTVMSELEAYDIQTLKGYYSKVTAPSLWSEWLKDCLHGL